MAQFVRTQRSARCPALRLVVALQRDLNERHVDEINRLQALSARVNHGSKRDQILGNGETLKEAPAH
jgi:hypothetical protein